MLEASGAYVLWGLLPIYWKLLERAGAVEILAHRILWSMVFLVLIVLVRRDLQWLVSAREPKVIATFVASSILLTTNWGIYIWAVINERIVETSLGYFIAPIAMSLMGVVFLREKLGRARGLAMAFALAGVLWLTFRYGTFPWVALALAFTWSIYGLTRKVARLGSLHGLLLETIVISPVALIWLLQLEAAGQGGFWREGAGFSLLLAGAGVATSVPLLLFASAARRISLVDVGILQYVAPTIQLLIGVLIYGEDASLERMIGFVLIWIGLLIFVGGLLRKRREVALI